MGQGTCHRILGLVVCFTSGSIFCCKEQSNQILKEVSHNGLHLTEIYFDNIPKDTLVLGLSDVFEDPLIVPFETRKECLIGDQSMVIINGEDIFIGASIYREPARILRFDHSGKFLNNIGSPGKGPGEHTSSYISQIIPDEESGTIVINWSTNQVDPQQFEYDGTYLQTINCPYRFLNDIYPLSSSEFFSTGQLSGNVRTRKDSVRVVFYSSDGTITGVIPRVNYPEKSDNYRFMLFVNPVSRFKENWKLQLSGIDTIFQLENRNLVPNTIFIRGENGVPVNEEISPEELTGKFLTYVLAETDNNYVLRVQSITHAEVIQYSPGSWGQNLSLKPQLLIVDKKSHKARYVKFKDDIYQFFPDELLNITPDWYAFASELMWQDDGRASIMLQSLGYLKILQECEIPQDPSHHLENLLNKLKDLEKNSNPVLFTFRLKDRIRIE